jgi:hypothetical protein
VQGMEVATNLLPFSIARRRGIATPRVVAAKHPDPRQRILRALRTEHLLPALARHGLDPDRALEHRGEGGARSLGETRAAHSSSTTRIPIQSSRRSAAARRPTSCVATIGNSLSAGCRKLGSTPSSRAEGTSQSAFSINQPGLRKELCAKVGDGMKG